MKTPLKKVLRDLSANKARTSLVILAVCFGVFGTGLILDLYSIAGREMDNSFWATNPYSFSIRINGDSADCTASLSETAFVEQVEARRTVRARTEVAPDVWRTSYLYIIEDFANVRIDKFTPVAGRSTPGIGEVLIEKESLTVIDRQISEAVCMKISSQTPQTLVVAGSVHAPGLKPAWMEKTVYGFITPETLSLLGASSENTDLLVVVSEDIRYDKNAIRIVAFEIRDMLLGNGYKVDRVTIPMPGKHPNGDQMNALLFLFQLFGVLSLVLSGVLVVNMISSMLPGHVRQIGIMKAVGARRSQIAGVYYTAVLISGAAALVLAMPLAATASKMLADVCAAMLNFTVLDYHISFWSFALQLAAGLLVPALSATYPIIKGTGLTVREALQDYEINKQQFGSTWFEEALSRIQAARPILLSIRNTFRRRGRLILTVSTLAAGGMILIVSLNVKSSLDNTIDRAMASLGYDLQYYFSKPYPANRVMLALESIPDVEYIELLAGAMASMVYEDGAENNAFLFAAVPGNMKTLNLPVLQGRFIEQDDTNTIVLNHSYLDNEPHLRIGDTITIKINGRIVDWVIVGVVKEVGSSAKVYVNEDYYQAVFRQEGLRRAANIVTAKHDAKTQGEVSTLVEKALREADIDIMLSSSFSDTREIFTNHLAIIVGFLMAASVLVIIVGVMGLVSTMSINVMERIRKIGVMRSCGAVSNDILRIIIFESVFTGAMSWIISVALSIPLTVVIGDMFGRIFLQTPLDNVINLFGYALWLIAVTVISALVGFRVTLKALEIPVNEVLNYE